MANPQYWKNVFATEQRSRRGFSPLIESNMITANTPIGKRNAPAAQKRPEDHIVHFCLSEIGVATIKDCWSAKNGTTGKQSQILLKHLIFV